MTYTTVQDIRRISSIAANASECDIKSIPLVERTLFNGTLKDLKEPFETHRADYSAAVEWDATKQYSKGDVVKYEGIYKIALKDNLDKQPSKVEFWGNAPMFDKECLEDLWCNDVMPYIAHYTVHVDQPVLIASVRNSSGSGRDYVSAKSIEAVAQRSLFLADMAYENLKKRLSESNCLGVKITSDCKTCEEKLAEKIESSPPMELGGTKFY